MKGTQEKVFLKATRCVYDTFGDSFISKGTIIEAKKHPSISYHFIVKFPYGEEGWFCPLYSDAFQVVK